MDHYSNGVGSSVQVKNIRTFLSSESLVLENKSILPNYSGAHNDFKITEDFKMESANSHQQPIYNSIHPSKHPSSLLSTKMKSKDDAKSSSSYVNERVRALSVSHKTSAPMNPLSQSVGSVQGFLSGLSSKHSSKSSETSSYCSGYSASNKFSRNENHRASYNDKKSAKISMFKSSKKFEPNCNDVQQEVVGKWYTNPSDSDSEYFKFREQNPPANSFLMSKKYQSHHQSSSSLDLDMDYSSNTMKVERISNIEGKRMTPLLHREFGSQGSIDIMGKYSDDSNPEFLKNDYLLSKRGSDPIPTAQAISSPKQRSKRITSKLWGDKDRPSIFRKLKSGSKDSKTDESVFKEPKPRKEDDRSRVEHSRIDENSINYSACDKSVNATPSKGTSRVTSLLCTSTAYNANTSFSGMYMKTEEASDDEMGSIELLADSRLSSNNKSVLKTKNNITNSTKNSLMNQDSKIVKCDDTDGIVNSKQMSVSSKSKSKSNTTQQNSVNNVSSKNGSKDSPKSSKRDAIASEDREDNEDRSMVFASPYIYQPGFAHHDVRSMSTVLLPEFIQTLLSSNRNIITGATAAAMAYNNLTSSSSNHSLYNNDGETETSSGDTLVDVDKIESGDGRSNVLLESCPYFVNELGGENDRNISLTKESSITASLIYKCAPDGSQDNPSNLNKDYINSHPWQYLHRPVSAATIGVLEPVANWITLPTASSEEKTETEGTEEGQEMVPKGVLKQEMCPYAKCAVKVEEYDMGASYYKAYFLGHEHQNYVGMDEGGFGPVSISYRRERIPTEVAQNSATKSTFYNSDINPSSGSSKGNPSQPNPEKDTTSNSSTTTPCFLHRIIIRTSQLNSLQGAVVEFSADNSSKKSSSGSGGGGGPGTKDVVEYICPKLPTACLYTMQNNDKAVAALHRLDSLSVHKKFKAGVLYCRPKQTTEEQMYGNKDAGPAFEEFLEALGQRVRMKGFNKHRAGLDNKNDSTGEYSVYSTYQGCEVMFHVSTLLPYTPSNSKQLLRKRHIGNDIVTIIFQEPGCEPFSPRVVRSHFQHVFIVVRAVNPCSSEPMYHVSVSRYHTVPSFGPAIPTGGMFMKGKTFSHFLLAKIINGETATLKSDKFSLLSIRTRHEYLKDLVSSYSTNTPLEPNNKFSIIGFSRGLSSRRDKSRSLGFCASSAVLGALSWSVLVMDHTIEEKIECRVGISAECLVVVESSSGAVLLSVPTVSVLGWTALQGQSVKIFYHQGESFTLCVRPDCSDDQKFATVSDIVSRLSAVTNGSHTENVLITRHRVKLPDGLLGFNVQQDGVVSEVTTCGAAYEAGLRAGSRIMEICYVAMPTITQDMMVDLLKTSKEVNLLVIPPSPIGDKTPRRGCNVPSCAFHLVTDSSEGDYENLSSPESSGSGSGNNRVLYAKQTKHNGSTARKDSRSKGANAASLTTSAGENQMKGGVAVRHTAVNNIKQSSSGSLSNKSVVSKSVGSLNTDNEDTASMTASTTTLMGPPLSLHPDYNTNTISSTHSNVSSHSSKTNHSSHSNSSGSRHVSRYNDGNQIYDTRAKQHESLYDSSRRTYDTVRQAVNGEPIYNTHHPVPERIYDTKRSSEPVTNFVNLVSEDTIYNTEPIYDTSVTPRGVFIGDSASESGIHSDSSSGRYDSMKAANTPGIPFQSASASPYKHPPARNFEDPAHPTIKKSLKPTSAFMSTLREGGDSNNSPPPPPLPARFAHNKRRGDLISGSSSSNSSSPILNTPSPHLRQQCSASSSPNNSLKAGGNPPNPPLYASCPSPNKSFQSTLGIWQQYTGGNGRQSNYAVPPSNPRAISVKEDQLPQSRSDTPSSTSSHHSRTDSPNQGNGNKYSSSGDGKPKLRTHKKQQNPNRNSASYSSNLQQELYNLINPESIEKGNGVDSRRCDSNWSSAGKYGLNAFPNSVDTSMASLPPPNINQKQVSHTDSIYESISLPSDGCIPNSSPKQGNMIERPNGNIDSNANVNPDESPADIINRLRGGVKEAVELGKLPAVIYQPAEHPDDSSEVDQEWSTLVNAASHAIGKTSQALSNLKKLPTQSTHSYRPLEISGADYQNKQTSQPILRQNNNQPNKYYNQHQPGQRLSGLQSLNNYINSDGGGQFASLDVGNAIYDTPKNDRNEHMNNNVKQQRAINSKSMHEEEIKRSLQERINELEAALQSEREKGSSLSAEVSTLRSQNLKLQEDSRAAARELHHFTDWFFATIDKN